MSVDEIKDFIKEKHLDYINDYFFDRYNKMYDNIVMNFYRRIEDKYKIDPANSFNCLKKLKRAIEEFEEEGGKVSDIYDEAQSLAEEEDEEEQRDEWEMEHDDEEPDESEFNYEPNYDQQAYYFENHFLDLAKQHSDEMEKQAKQSIEYARMRNTQGLDFINAVFGEWDRLAASYDEIIEERIKVEKQWLKTLTKNKRNIFKGIFENIELNETWYE